MYQSSSEQESPIKFLQQAPSYLFFTGKGGVGKTSIACASALKMAESGHRVLLVSTDPASNVAQVFGVEIGNQITAIHAVQNLDAIEIDPQQAAQAYRDRIVGPMRGVLPEAEVKGMEEQLSGACTTEIAAFDEFTGLLTNSAIKAEYDYIIFDTAPTGHTIRLLQLPFAWSGFLETGKGDASCLGPLAGLEKQRIQYQQAVKALSDSEKTRLVLVARAQTSALQEAARTYRELTKLGIKNQFLVINAVMPISEAEQDNLAAAIVSREQQAIANIPSEISSLPTDQLTIKPFNLVGPEALRRLFDTESKSMSPEFERIKLPALSSLVDDIASDEHGLVMLMGKGGVGKTTLAAAVAVELAQRGLPVHLTTSDPAAHLSQTLEGALDNLTVSRIDPVIETERYRQHVIDTKGRQLDDEGLALLKEDLQSPCTEEIAVFQAFSRVIREAGKKFVVMDTAPTGHTLLLLDATGAYHREVERQMGERGLHFTTPLMHLQDSRRTKVLLVTLAETTPVLEAAELQDDLRRAGIEPWAWLINNSVAASDTRSTLLLQRAACETDMIKKIVKHHAKRYAVVPLLDQEPVGISKLLMLTGSYNVSPES